MDDYHFPKQIFGWEERMWVDLEDGMRLEQATSPSMK